MRPIDRIEEELREEVDRLSAEVVILRAANTELREWWLKGGWRPMETAPRDGTVVDLYGNNRDPEASAGILLPLAASEGRYVDCFYGTPMDKPDTSELVMPKPAGWYRAGPSDPGSGLHYERIWPTHWRPVPGKPS